MKIQIMGRTVILRAEEGCVITNAQLQGPWTTKVINIAAIDRYEEMRTEDYWNRYNEMYPTIEEGDGNGEE